MSVGASLTAVCPVVAWNSLEHCPSSAQNSGGGGRFVAFITLRLHQWHWGPSVGGEGSVSWPGTLWHSAPFVGESYMCWDFTNSKRCKIPAIRKARVCDGIEFSLALSQYSQWRIILHGSRNRHFYVLLIFYLKLNCRYRVINKIHPCLSHTNSFLSKVFSWLLGNLGWLGGRRIVRWGQVAAVQTLRASLGRPYRGWIWDHCASGLSWGWSPHHFVRDLPTACDIWGQSLPGWCPCVSPSHVKHWLQVFSILSASPSAPPWPFPVWPREKPNRFVDKRSSWPPQGDSCSSRVSGFLSGLLALRRCAPSRCRQHTSIPVTGDSWSSRGCFLKGVKLVHIAL